MLISIGYRKVVATSVVLSVRSLNRRINRIHERCLRMVYNDYESSFELLLEKDGSVKIHEKNIQVLVTEMFKIKHNIAPVIMNEILPINSSHYNFRNINDFKRDNIRSVYYGENSLRYVGPILWSLVPIEIQNCTSLPAFKNCIRSWVPTNCPCRLCKTYLPELGFV